MAGLFNAWLQYSAEIRLTYIVFYACGHRVDETDDRLTSCLGLLSLRGCDLDVTKSPTKGDVLRLKHGPHQRFLIAFDDRGMMERWKEEIRRIGMQPRVTVQDFEVISPIGNGAGGKVRDKRGGTNEMNAEKCNEP